MACCNNANKADPDRVIGHITYKRDLTEGLGPSLSHATEHSPCDDSDKRQVVSIQRSEAEQLASNERDHY